MNKNLPSPVVRMQKVRNRTQTGKRTSKAARRAAIYFAYGRELPTKATEAQAHQRGHWLGPGGETYSHEAALAWAQDAAKKYEYTFQALLSVPEGRLTTEDYGRVLEQALCHWYDWGRFSQGKITWMEYLHLTGSRHHLRNARR